MTIGSWATRAALTPLSASMVSLPGHNRNAPWRYIAHRTVEQNALDTSRGVTWGSYDDGHHVHQQGLVPVATSHEQMSICVDRPQAVHVAEFLELGESAPLLC